QNVYYVYFLIVAPGQFYSGYAAPSDIEMWTDARTQTFVVEMQECDATGSPFTPAKVFDGMSHTFHASLLARQTVLNQSAGNTTIGASLGISESLSSISQSRHYQTPKIIAADRGVLCANGSASYASMHVYVKGRIVTSGS